VKVYPLGHKGLQYGSFREGISFAMDTMDHLASQAAIEKRPFRVIDVGGGHSGDLWDGRVTAVVDLLRNADLADDVEFYKIDISCEEQWKSIENDLLKNGKFDFCICRHTLEDLDNPDVTTKWLSKLADVGYIGVPSYFTELSRSEDHPLGAEYDTVSGQPPGSTLNQMRGYTHHKWIFFAGVNGTILAYPKVSWVDSLPDEWFLSAGIAQNMFGGFFNNNCFPQDMSFCWTGVPKIIYLNVSLQLEKKWGRNQKAICNALGWENMPLWVNGVSVDVIQDWTFLFIIAQACRMSDDDYNHYMKLQKTVVGELARLEVVEDNVTIDNFPWFSFSRWCTRAFTTDNAHTATTLVLRWKPDPASFPLPIGTNMISTIPSPLYPLREIKWIKTYNLELFEERKETLGSK
jgi:hypothetical protein